MDNISRILKMNVQQLREELTRMALDINGNKIELQERLIAVEITPQNMTDKDEVASNISNNGYTSCDDLSQEKEIRHETKYSFRDLEGAVNKFSGDDNYMIKMWIQDFEEMSSDVQFNFS